MKAVGVDVVFAEKVVHVNAPRRQCMATAFAVAGGEGCGAAVSVQNADVGGASV